MIRYKVNAYVRKTSANGFERSPVGRAFRAMLLAASSVFCMFLALDGSPALAEGADAREQAARLILGEPRALLPSRSTTLAVSPDGQTAAVGTFAGGEVVLWDVATNTATAILRPDVEQDPGPVTSLNFSSDGTLLAATQLRHPGVRVWHVEDRRLVRTIELPGAESIRRAVFSPHRRLLAISRPGQVTIVDADSGEVSSRIATGANQDGVSLTWSSCGEIIRVGGNFDQNRLAWFRVSDGRRVGQSPPLDAPAHIVIPLPGNQVAVSRGPGGLSRVALEDWSHLAILAPHGRIRMAAARTAADGSVLVTRSDDFRIHASRLESRELGETFVQIPLGIAGAHVGGAFADLAVTPDGKLVGWTRRDRHFEMLPLREDSLLSGPPGHRGAVRNVRWGSTGQTLFSYGDDGVLIAWDVEQSRDRWRRQAGPVSSPLWARASAETASVGSDFWILVSGEAELRFTRWSEDGTLLQDSSLTATSPRAAAIDVGQKMGLASGQRHQGIWSWNLLTDITAVNRFTATSEQAVIDAALSSNGQWLAVRNPAGIEIWDQRGSPAEQPYLTLLSATNTPLASQLAWSPSGWLLAASGSGQAIHIFEVLSGEEIHTFEPIGFGGSAGLMDYPRPFIWVADDQYLLAVGDQKEVSIIDLRMGQEVLRLTGAGSRVVSLDSRQGKLAAGLEDGSVAVWHLPKRIREETRREHPIAEIRRDWKQLGKAKGWEIVRLISRLADQPEAVTEFLAKEMVLAQIDPDSLADLLDGLGSELFRVREESMEELKVVAEIHAEELSRLLAGRHLPEEARWRVEQVLADRSDGWRENEEVRQMLRGLWILQSIGTPESRQVISNLAKRSVGNRITRQAERITDIWPAAAEP